MKRSVFTRALTASLAALFILLTASCGDTGGAAPAGGGSAPGGGDSAETEAVTEVTTTSALSTIPENDFEGRAFRAVSTNQDNRHVDIVAEEENGATLNDLVYYRNRAVEESFNVTLETAPMDYSAINSLVQKSVSAGDNPYDLYMSNVTANTLASGGYLIAWNTVPSMDVTKDWWDQGAIRDMSIAGNSFLITGDISPTGLLTSECILFNKRLLENVGIEAPYDDAFAGTWTVDDMIALTAGLSTDVDGDGKLTDKSDDVFSFTLWYDAAAALYYGMGGSLSVKDADDLPKLDYGTEKDVAIYNKIWQLVMDNEANYSMSDHELSFKVFNDGRAYFCDITFQKIEMFLRGMEDDFGVLPLPKFDESQDVYQTNVSGAGTMLVLPKSTEDLEFAGTLIDAMAAASYDMITPSLFDVIAGTKNVRDEESSDMVQMIIRSRVFDLARMYDLPGSDFAHLLLQQKSTDVVSYFAGIEANASASLQKLVDAFLAAE